MAFIDIHDYLFEFLLKEAREIPDLRFRVRKTNRSNKLREGYWFLGNENYLNIGFWEGVNWKSRVSNIAFVVYPSGRSKLVFNTTDSEEKRKFVNQKVLPEIDYKKKSLLKEKNIETWEEYDNPYTEIEFVNANYKDAIYEFLDFYWPKIDEIIRNSEVNSEIKLPIKVIESDTFRKDIHNVRRHKGERERLEKEIDMYSPFKLSQFSIENYGPIKKCSLRDIPFDNQWIFLTGENGTGKSSIVKALATAIAHRHIPKTEIKENPNFKVELEFHGERESKFEIVRTTDNTNRVKPYSVGFSAYGPFRLNPIYGKLKSGELKQAKNKTGRFKSLFENNSYLLDLESEFKSWRGQKIKTFEKRKYAIKEFLQEALLNIQLIEFEYASRNTVETRFHEEDKEGNLLEPVDIEKLSSGYKSIMAMMSDMLIRLFQQQPKIHDPGELRGIVIIDEIDIHLHPKFQKHLIEQLTQAFPNIQFIVTTHSPIPLLGAPETSMICVVERDNEAGVKIRRLDEVLPIENMMPNNLLSSPIFGLKDLFPNTHSKEKKIRTEDSYEDILKNDQIRSYLKKVAENLDKK
ncbi:AAA family ATPase [uncultured Christiangramia sp.]|uniref:AAA family ATPase n=1 Tax=uncultured Christiangramia sp. TaxID=503836 RepID=UPI002616744F|nr:AAA family ATPase [uncultured Christiangramia sp.]